MPINISPGSRPLPGEQLGAELAETGRVWRGLLDQRLQSLGLSQARWLILLHLSKRPKGLKQVELARRIGIRPASLSLQVERLVQQGWVQRNCTQGDRRSNTLCLTKQARNLSQQIMQTAARVREELLAGLASEDIECCGRVLAHIRQRAQSL